MADHSTPHFNSNPPILAAQIMTVMVALFVLLSIYTQGLTIALTSEEGGLEIASAIVPMAIGLFLIWDGTLGGRFWMVPVFFLLIALREMDFQNWFFDPGLLRTEIFGSAAPLWQQAVSALAMVAILVTLVMLVARGAGPALAGLRAREPWVIAVIIALVLAAISTQLDGFDANMRAFGWAPSLGLTHIAQTLEEPFELGFSIALGWSVALWFGRDARF